MKLLQISICLVLSYNVIGFTIFNQPQPNLQPPPQLSPQLDLQPPPQPLAEAFTQVESGATIWRGCCIFIPDL